MKEGSGALAGVGVGLVSGLVATKAMEPVTTKLYELESEEDKRREREVQPRTSFVVAAERTARAVGVELDEERAKRLGALFHYALGASGGTLYLLLRATTRLHPIAVGTAVGLGMFAGIDEVANTAFGFTAPPHRFPLSAHARGLVGHLAYGLALAAAAEVALALVGRRRRGWPERIARGR
jgi:hypothetical protein